ncbi:MAG: N-glycosylase/DNA lyase [Candidatus Bathyarchaeota archaeon]
MEKLIKIVRSLCKSKVKSLVDARLREFKRMGEASSREVFKELCFCILTANFNAEKCIKIQDKIGDGFLYLPEEKLAETLKKLGHRYPYTRARYIVEARKYKDKLKNIITSFKNDEEELRSWLVKNVKGIGYKEASHFLRNIGYTNFAILDFHIINILTKYRITKKPKTLTRKEYLKIENIMREIAKKLNLNLAELDLYLWYIETKKILK